jgi:branched-chain amino acid transport system substrate-binding protein
MNQRHNALRALAAAVALAFVASPALAQEKVKVGFMLPYTGTFAALGNAITNGFKLAIAEQGGKLGGRDIDYVTVDDESDPAKAPENVNKLIKRDNVDVIVGTVHSGVAMAMAKAAKDNNALLLIPNAGQDEITGPLCAPNIIRTSFANSSPGYAMGKVAADRGYKTVVTLAWKYAAGDQSGRRLQGGVRERRRQGRQGAVAAVPDGRVPAVPDRDRVAQARRGVRVLRGRRRGEAGQGLRRGGLRKTIPLLGPASSPTARWRRRARRPKGC